MVFLTQLPMILFIAGSKDLLFGFNQTDAGFASLVFLFFSVPVINLGWIVAEIVLLVRKSREQGQLASMQMTGIALFFFVESVAIDLYLLSQVRM
ncbi:MAG: hypothetical protein ABW116_10535 [Candidatus Sedimenticola sp. 20ELBAFRAG]